MEYSERKAVRELEAKESGEGLAGQEEKAEAEKERLSARIARGRRTPVEEWFGHDDYIANLVGKEFVGLGSDFDGIGAWPGELKDITSIDLITAGLLKRGWSEKELAGFYSGNLLRVWRKVEEVAGEFRANVRELPTADAEEYEDMRHSCYNFAPVWGLKTGLLYTSDAADETPG